MEEIIIKTEGGSESVELNKLYKIKFKFGITTLERTGNIIRDNNNFFFKLPTQEPGGEVKNPGRYRLYADQNNNPGSNNNPITKIYYAIESTLIKSIEKVETGGGKYKKRRRKKRTKRRKSIRKRKRKYKKKTRRRKK